MNAYEDFLKSMEARVGAPVSSQKAVLALPLTTLAPLETRVIEITPQVDFKGEVLILSDSAPIVSPPLGRAGNFTIDSVKVGREEQLLSSSGIPGQVFAQGVIQPMGLNMKVCPLSLSIFVTVTNLVNDFRPISGVFIGSCGGCNESSNPVPQGPLYPPIAVLPIPITTIAKGDTQTISIPVQVPFTGQQIVIPTSMADAAGTLMNPSEIFTINSVKVGRDEMLMSSDPVPAAVFAVNAPMEVGFSMTKCPPWLTIEIEVTNLDANDPRDFGGAFFGFCGDDGNCNSGWCTDCDLGAGSSRIRLAGSL